jgi:hypothetical protein
MRAIVAAAVMGAGLSLAACDPPPDAGPVGAAVVAVPASHHEAMPPPVAKTVAELERIAKEGGYRDLANLASRTPDFRSNNAGMSHSEYWYLKMRTGDWPMAQVARLLSYRFTVADTSEGKVYIWPYMARLKPEQINSSAGREIDRLLGEGQAQAMRKGAIWPGYVLGIREDGTWLYFVSGTG